MKRLLLIGTLSAVLAVSGINSSDAAIEPYVSRSTGTFYGLRAAEVRARSNERVGYAIAGAMVLAGLLVGGGLYLGLRSKKPR